MNRRNRTLMMIFAALLFAGLLVLYMYSLVSNITFTAPEHPLGTAYANFSMLSNGLLTHNNGSEYAAYSVVRYSMRNVTMLNASLSLYGSNPVQRIFVVDPANYCVDCGVGIGLSLYNDLESELGNGFLANGTSLNYININNLSGVPPRSIVILPTGLMPDILLPYTNSTGTCKSYKNFTIVNLLNRGDTVIYVGGGFSTVVTCGPQIAKTPVKTISALSNISINTTVSPYYLANSSYTFNGSKLYFRSPSFGLAGGDYLDGVVSVKSLNGTFMALSDYPTKGWNNSAALLAKDLAYVLDSRYWMDRIAYGSYNLSVAAKYNATDSGNLTLITLNSLIKNVHNVSDMVNSSYPLVVMKFSNGSNTTYERDIPLRMRLPTNGYIYTTSPSVGENQTLTITLQARNITGPDAFHILLYNASLRVPIYGYTIAAGNLRNNAVFYEYASYKLPSGYYILALIDQNNRTYSKALFYLQNVTLDPQLIDFKNGTFVFSAYSAGRPVNGEPFSADIGGAYPSTGVVRNGVLNYTLPKGSVISYGNQTFSIGLFGDTYSITEENVNNGIRIPAFYIEFGIAALFVLVLNMVLKAPTTDEYYVDVPDFPPSRKMKVKEKPEAILNVFEAVNYYYHWKHMPLSPEEVKAGISSNIRYQNMPISITLQNTLAVLNRMSDKGLLAESDGFYAPKKWIEESGHSIEYLTIFRRIRDYCVANGLLFSDLNGSEIADVVISNKGTQSYVMIHSDERMKKIGIDHGAKVFVVFLNEDRRNEFLNRLYNSYGTEAELLKMAIDYSSVRLIDVDDLGQLSIA